MKTAAGISLSRACSNTHRRWRWQPLCRQKLIGTWDVGTYMERVKQKSWWKCPVLPPSLKTDAWVAPHRYIALILTSMLLCEAPDVLVTYLQNTQLHRKPDSDLCVWGGKGRSPGLFVCSSGVSGVRLQIRWTDFSKASLHSAWQPSTCCVLSLLKEESRTVSL